MLMRGILKRLFDLVCAGAGLVLLSPLLAAIAVLVRLADGGPVLFRQERIGYRGKPFGMWKFRSMVPDADKMGKSLTIGADPRITRIGGWLRKLKFDELPQLINVVMGEMSLVGPRPEVAHYVEQYTQEQLQVLEIMPGITDPASVKYYDETELLGQTGDPESLYLHKIMPEKIRINLAYARQATLWSDVRVILSTFIKIAGPVKRRIESRGMKVGGVTIDE
ncbi:MAG: sugar transferase [Anaerolineae bacterium]|nr:sugar transferase [Anaerolineae bacterium]